MVGRCARPVADDLHPADHLANSEEAKDLSRNNTSRCDLRAAHVPHAAQGVGSLGRDLGRVLEGVKERLEVGLEGLRGAARKKKLMSTRAVTGPNAGIRLREVHLAGLEDELAELERDARVVDGRGDESCGECMSVGVTQASSNCCADAPAAVPDGWASCRHLELHRGANDMATAGRCREKHGRTMADGNSRVWGCRTKGALTLDEASYLGSAAACGGQALQSGTAELRGLRQSSATGCTRAGQALGSLGGGLAGLFLRGLGGVGGVAHGGAAQGEAGLPQHGTRGGERHLGGNGGAEMGWCRELDEAACVEVQLCRSARLSPSSDSGLAR